MRRPLESVDLSPLVHEREGELLRALALYPDVVADAADTRAPQKVSTWVRDFARAFHGFYRDCRVITDDAELTQARLWLAEACRIGLANALGLLGVSAPEEMARLDDEDERRRVSDAAVRSDAAARRRPASSPTAASRSAASTSSGSRPSSALRSTCTTRTSCAPAAASTAPASASGVAYASKAFLCTAMAQLVAEEGLDLDVATGGELHVALHAGFPAERIVFHGNNKSTDELRAALDAGVGRIVVDSFDEIDRLEPLADDGASAVRRAACA